MEDNNNSKQDIEATSHENVEDTATHNINEAPQASESKKPAGMSKAKKLLVIGGVTLLVLTTLGVVFTLNKDRKDDTVKQTQQSEVKKFGVAVGLIEGLVQYSADAQTWQDLKAETDLKEGNSVRTASNGRAVLLIDDGSALRLDSNSEIKLTSLTTTAILITNTSGELYHRVVASDTRSYTVTVENENYKAKGTAYRTFNEKDKKGVEVFQSAVEAVIEKKEVGEGKSLYTKHAQADKVGVVLALDVESLKNDDFIKWNSEQDKKVANYADKLGILSELDKPAPTPAPAPRPTATAGISLTGSKSEYSAVFSWKITSVDTSKGFKLVRSSSSKTPTYPENTVAYIEAGKTSYTLYVGEDTPYNYRICAYSGSSCASYSNSVTVTTLKKVQETLVPGAVSLSLNGKTLSWSILGTAPFGFKIVVGTTTGPTYSNNYKKYFTSSTSYDLTNGYLTAGDTYYAKVCKYLNGDCTDYSNEIMFTH